MLSERNVEGSCHLGMWLFITMHQCIESVVAYQALHDCRFVQLNHPAYSPDLGPSDYSVFRNRKFHLCGTRFTDVESLKVAAEAWFDRLNGKTFFQLVNSVEEKEKNCADVAGECSEK